MRAREKLERAQTTMHAQASCIQVTLREEASARKRLRARNARRAGKGGVGLRTDIDARVEHGGHARKKPWSLAEEKLSSEGQRRKGGVKARGKTTRTCGNGLHDMQRGANRPSPITGTRESHNVETTKEMRKDEEECEDVRLGRPPFVESCACLLDEYGPSTPLVKR